jgi:MFS-type transporter involved in bile tolerance (Atg22 family)
MYSGARKEFIGGLAFIGVALLLPMAAIMGAVEVYDDPVALGVLSFVLLASCGGLGAAVFYDAFGPVMEAQAQAAQMKAYQLERGVGKGLGALTNPTAVMKQVKKATTRPKKSTAARNMVRLYYRMQCLDDAWSSNMRLSILAGGDA